MQESPRQDKKGPPKRAHQISSAGSSVIDDQPVAFLLKPYQLEDRGGDCDGARDEVRHDLVHDLVRRLAVGVAIVGDRQTGVSMYGLVSS
jgi:hypothetical protein